MPQSLAAAKAALTVDIDPILKVVRAGLPIAKMLAAISSTTWDDSAVALIEQASTEGSPLLTLLRSVLNDPLVVSGSGDVRLGAIRAAMEPHKSAVVAAGFDWWLLLQKFPQIVTFVLTLLGLRR